MAQLNIYDVLRAISDDKFLAIFNTVALTADCGGSILLGGLKMTRKQYYFRMSAMIDASLITRRSGKYFLTSFGKIAYEAQMLIGRAQRYWKLKVVDTIESSSNNTLTPEERVRLINSLIVDNGLTGILLGRNKSKENNQELIALQQTLHLW